LPTAIARSAYVLFTLLPNPASKPLAFAELHPYNPLTGIMLCRALLIDSPEIPVQRKIVEKKIVEIKIVDIKIVEKWFHLSSFIALSYTMHAYIVQVFMVQARRQSFGQSGVVDSSSPRI